MSIPNVASTAIPTNATHVHIDGSRFNRHFGAAPKTEELNQREPDPKDEDEGWSCGPPGTIYIPGLATITALTLVTHTHSRPAASTNTSPTLNAFFSATTILSFSPDSTTMSPPTSIPDLYAELELFPYATTAAIKSAYRRLSLAHHPDKNEDNMAAATAKMKKLNNALDVLMVVGTIPSSTASRMFLANGVLPNLPCSGRSGEKHGKTSDLLAIAGVPGTGKSRRLALLLYLSIAKSEHGLLIATQNSAVEAGLEKIIIIRFTRS